MKNTDSNASAAFELHTPYFLEADGTIRDSRNLLVCEVFDYNEQAIRQIISALNRYDYLEKELATATDRIAQLEREVAAVKKAIFQANACLSATAPREAMAEAIEILSEAEQHYCNGVYGGERHGTSNACSICGRYRSGFATINGTEEQND